MDHFRHYLSSLFEPSCIAVFGASQRKNALATVVLKNIIANEFAGSVIPINPKYSEVENLPCFKSLEDADKDVELAIIATPAKTVPDILEQCGEAGVKAAIVISGGFQDSTGDTALEEKALEVARRYGIRFVGPDCLGIIRPSTKLNASYAGGNVQPGNIALISQSGAVCTGILDWAESQGIGFSTVVSIGKSIEVDFGELLDYLISDPKTQSILLYVEGIRDARAFMSGLRAVARVKPVILVKAGRSHVSVRAAQLHTGAVMGADDVFGAAVRRAGVVRGSHIGDLFAATTVLSRDSRLRGEHLAILTNGGGPAAMACDRAHDLNIPLAVLEDSTVMALNKVHSGIRCHGNPVDILGDADPERYQEALKILLGDEQTDGVIVMLSPQAMTDPLEIAKRIVAVSKTQRKPILACWMGEQRVQEARRLLRTAGIPAFRLPETTVQGFAYLTNFFRNQKLLLQTPGPLSEDESPDLDGAKLIVSNALAEKRRVLSITEAKALLSAFRIRVATAIVTRSAIEAVTAAGNLGFPVAMKVYTTKLERKSDVGGVRLNIGSAAAVHATYNELSTQMRERKPPIPIDGVVVEPMVRSANARELHVGIQHDAVFGPVVSFGTGGSNLELITGRSVSLPPLNRMLAKDLVSHARIAPLLEAHRTIPAADHKAIEDALLRVSEIACEIPEVVELDINPLIVDERGAIVVDARVRVEPFHRKEMAYSHTAIHPYPTHLTKEVVIAGGLNCKIRPIRPEDAEMEREFVEGLSDSAKRYRFMNTFQQMPPEMLARFTQIDYDREMALIAVLGEGTSQIVELGVARYAINFDGQSCEFAITVADDWQGKGLARHLMDMLMDYARYRGIKRMNGEVLSDNGPMLKLAAKLGFRRRSSGDPSVTMVEREL